MSDTPFQKLRTFWIKANSTTVKQFILETPTQYFRAAATIVLSFLSILPVFVSLTFRKSPELIDGLIDLQYANMVYTNVFGAYWYRWLLITGFATGLLSVYVFLKKRYSCPPLKDISIKIVPKFAYLPTCLGFLLLWSILSALFSDNYRYAFLGTPYRQEGVLTYCFYATVFISATLLSEKQMKLVAEILVASCAFTGILAITKGQIFPDLFYLETNAHSVMFHNDNHYGYYLATCLPICFGLALLDRPSKKSFFLRIVEFWLICNAVAYNNSRGSFLAISITLFIWNIIILQKNQAKWKRLLLMDAFFLISVIFLHTESVILDRFYELINQIRNTSHAMIEGDTATVESAINNIGTQRGLLWKLGIQFACQKPIWGYGPENLGNLYLTFGTELIDKVDRPHNELIQIAASLGLPALIFYVTGIVSHIRDFFRNYRKLSILHLSLFASAGCYFVSSMFGNSMYYTTPYYFMMLAFSYQICRNLSSKSELQS